MIYGDFFRLNSSSTTGFIYPHFVVHLYEFFPGRYDGLD